MNVWHISSSRSSSKQPSFSTHTQPSSFCWPCFSKSIPSFAVPTASSQIHTKLKEQKRKTTRRKATPKAAWGAASSSHRSRGGSTNRGTKTLRTLLQSKQVSSTPLSAGGMAGSRSLGGSRAAAMSAAAAVVLASAMSTNKGKNPKTKKKKGRRKRPSSAQQQMMMAATMRAQEAKEREAQRDAQREEMLQRLDEAVRVTRRRSVLANRAGRRMQSPLGTLKERTESLLYVCLVFAWSCFIFRYWWLLPISPISSYKISFLSFPLFL